MDAFLEVYDKHWEVRVCVQTIIAIVVIGLVEAVPGSWIWLVGFSVVSMLGAVAAIIYKRRQWQKEDAQTP